MKTNSKGFTLIELMVVVLIIGILAAIAYPNFARVKDHAMESNVKANMHTIQTMVENWAVGNDGLYPLPADDAALEASFPNGAYPDNPFTNAPTAVAWGAAPAAPGAISFTTSTILSYEIQGYGRSNVLSLVLRN